MAANAIGAAAGEQPEIPDPAAALGDPAVALGGAAKSGGFGGLMGKIGLGGKKPQMPTAGGLMEAGKGAALAEAKS